MSSKRYAKQPGADQVQAWKAAAAAHNRAKRNRRWKRPDAQITGFVIMPPSDRPAGGIWNQLAAPTYTQERGSAGG